MSTLIASVIVHAFWRAAYKSKTTNAEASIVAAYGLPIEYPEKRVFLDMPCVKRVDRDKYASVHWSATKRTKSACLPADELQVNH